MAEIFEMPQASPTMEAGTILSWHKEEGAVLVPQDVIAEVETDKAAMSIEVFDAGVLLKILVPAGDEVPAGAPIAIIGSSADEDIGALLEQAQARLAALKTAGDQPISDAAAKKPSAGAHLAASAPLAAPAATATPVAPAERAPLPAVGLPPLTWAGRPVASAIMEAPRVFGGPALAALGPPSGSSTRSSPASRRAARASGLEITSIAGTGPRGRVTVADVTAVGTTSPAPTQRPAIGPPHPDELVKNSQMRKTIARRLTQAYLGAPTFFLNARLDCDHLVAFRTQLKAAGLRVSYNDILVKAAARALRDVPEVNASWGDQAITRHGGVHIGVAVALPDGLITPVIRDADRVGLEQIGQQTRDLAERARARQLQPPDYQGSTFTISNLGMMDIEHFTAIINPPEAAILAVGGLQQEAVVRDGELIVAWQLRVTMTCDHRVIDGALGARFLQALRRYIEAPALLAA